MSSPAIALENGDGTATTLPADLTPADVRPVTVDTTEPAPVAVPEAPAPVAPPAAPPAPVDDAPREKNGILADLRSTREQARGLKDFQEKAAPILSALQAHPDIIAELERRRTGGAPPAAPAFPAAEIESTARDLALYLPDGSGKLDLAAAQRVLERETTRTQGLVKGAVDQIVAREIAPIRQTMQQSQAQEAGNALIVKARGQGVSDDVMVPLVTEIAKSNPGMLSQPGFDVVAIALARGLAQMATGDAPATVATPAAAAPRTTPQPTFTEAAGGRPVAPAGLSRLEKRAAEAHGITTDRFQKIGAAMDRAEPGQPFTFGEK